MGQHLIYWNEEVYYMKENRIITEIFPDYLRDIAVCLEQLENLQEVHLRAGRPLLLMADNREYGITLQGEMTKNPDRAYRVNGSDLEAILMHLCHYSLYAYEDEIARGFITLKGGHRVGISGQAVMGADGIRSIKHITSMNLRIAHEVPGAADAVFPYLYEKAELQDCLLISPPGCGKTTLLRDIIRQVSDGNPYAGGKNVSVVDERSEIAGSYMGIMQNNLGSRTDLLDACPKAQGMMLLLRSMNPYLIAVDEIGGTEDAAAIRQILKCGCHILATVHGEGLHDIRKKEGMEDLIEEGAFKRYVILSRSKGAGTIERVLDNKGNQVIAR